MNPRAFINAIPQSICQYDTIETSVLYPHVVGCCLGIPYNPNGHKESKLAFQVPADSYLTVHDWIPKERPRPGEFFFGVQRYLDPTRLAGLFYEPMPEDGITEIYRIALALLNREGGTPDYAFVPSGLVNFFNAIGHLYAKPKIIGCPELDNEILLITSSTWKKYPKTITCSSPGFNMRILL